MLAAIFATLLLWVVVVRNAVVAEYAETQPRVASDAWPGHPSSQLWAGLTQIGLAARNGEGAPAEALQLIRNASIKSPLAAEPFVVRGIQEQVAGNPGLASQAFQSALLRDSRSIPARYFLAEQYFRGGDAISGLRQVASLARIVPGGVDRLGPYVAAYARDPKTRPQLLVMFRSDPQIEQSALTVLAADPANADLIMGLADPNTKSPQWAPRLLEGLVEAGEFEKAHSLWANLAHIQPSSDLVYDPQFRRNDALAPFAWTLTSSALGLAERQGNGRLHLLYYGHDDGVLAKQMLVLRPGRYRLAAAVSGDLVHARLLAWNVTCATSPGGLLLSLPLASAGVRGTFVVPESCQAQYLEVVGSAPDLPQQADVTISGLSLTREPADG